MSVKAMTVGTGVMFLGIAGMAANRISDGAIAKHIRQARCGDTELATCGLNTDMHWIIAMGLVFVTGVVINVYGRIKAANR